jgi:hypothetical protein
MPTEKKTGQPLNPAKQTGNVNGNGHAFQPVGAAKDINELYGDIVQLASDLQRLSDSQAAAFSRFLGQPKTCPNCGLTREEARHTARAKSENRT